MSKDLVSINVALLDALRSVVDLPKAIQSLKLTIEIDAVPTFEIRFYVNRSGIEGGERITAVTKRFMLIELSGESLEDVSVIGDTQRRFRSTSQ